MTDPNASADSQIVSCTAGPFQNMTHTGEIDGPNTFCVGEDCLSIHTHRRAGWNEGGKVIRFCFRPQSEMIASNSNMVSCTIGQVAGLSPLRNVRAEG